MKKYSLFLAVFLLAGNCFDPCSSVDCVNGECVDGDCVCNEGWTGTLCDVDLCAGINCGEHGDCVNGECVCDANYEGEFCEDIIDPCYDVDCGSHGDCVNGVCDCDPGWTGSDCSTEVTGGDLCSNTCGFANDGDCDDGGPGSDFSLCACGTDCADCGPRTEAECGGSGGTDAAISVWTAITSFPCNTARIDVYIDDTYEGYLDSYYSSEPECGDGGTVTTEVASGSHTLYAECNDGDTYWGPGTVSVASGYCLLLELTADKKLTLKQVKLEKSWFK